jgi:phosphohistidine phosphatase SixA
MFVGLPLRGAKDTLPNRKSVRNGYTLIELEIDMTDTVILVRHGKRARAIYLKEAEHGLEGFEPGNPANWPAPKFDGSGIEVVLALAGRLADELALENTTISTILHSEHKVARETAHAYAHVLNRRGLFYSKPQSCPSLTPVPRSCSPTAPDVARRIRENEAHAILVVGHQPNLTDIANELLPSGVPTGVLPLDNAESALICMKQKALRWCLTAKPESLRDDLVDKVKAKYDVAKFFLGAFVVNTGLVLNAGVFKAFADNPDSWRFGTLWCGVLFLVAALGFTVATLFGYDQLLMPRQFWGASSQGRKRNFWIRLLSVKDVVSRPPSQDQIVLYFNMVRIWSNLFVPALLSAFLSIGCFLCVLMAPSMPMPSWLTISLFFWLTISLFLGSAILLLALAGWAFASRGPDLGIDD